MNAPGNVAFWYFDENYQFKTNDISFDASITDVTMSFVDAFLFDLFVEADRSSPFSQELARAIEKILREAYLKWKLEKLSICSVVHPFDLQHQLYFGRQAEGAVDEGALRSDFDLDVVRGILGNCDILFDAALKGAMEIPCPFGEGMLRATAGLYVHNHCITYLFASSVGPLLLVTYGSSVCIPAALYAPTLNLFIVSYEDAIRENVINLFFPNYFSHILRYGGLIESNVRSEMPRGIALTTEIKHIGHHLWNELASLSLLCQRGVPNIVKFYVQHPDHTEHFGYIDQLFPEFNGLVERVRTSGIFPERFYQEAQIIVRIGGYYVPEDLSRRIGRTAVGEEPHFNVELSTLRSKVDLLVLISPRFENRRWENMVEECIAMISRLSEKRTVAVAFDGHNSSHGRSFMSHLEAESDSFVAMEKAFVKAIRQALPDGVAVVDNIGGSVARSILLSSVCDFFVCPWGAALAKYKWAARAVGIIASNTFCLTKKGDRHIYEDPCFVENGLPDFWFDPADIEDVGPSGLPAGMSGIDLIDRGDFRTRSGALTEMALDVLAKAVRS